MDDRIHFGAAYYPEHWPPAQWPHDIQLMQAAGFTVVRMAEFAWSALEPAEGCFDFDWLEEAITQLAAAGIQTVLGTPTAAPPAWLTQSRPQTLAVDETGRRVQHGNRCHYCVNSPEYHAAAARIAGAMAARFGGNPHVIGWQIDNEFCRPCYCDICQAAFVRFLQSRYGDLDTLNRRWSTAYWSQTYFDWDQVPIPWGGHNPGLMLEHRRFITDSYVRFQRAQLQALRPHLPPDVWITHNFMGWFDGFDHHTLSQELDLASWDWYVGSGRNDFAASGAMHNVVRGYKRRNFWIMETQPGTVNWSPLNNSIEPGETRALAWHAIGHGADGWLYWQWRSALGGQEQYHGTLVDQSGQPRPFYHDAQAIGRELAAASPVLAGSVPVAQAALLYSFDSRWAIQNQRHAGDFDYVRHLVECYRPLFKRNIPAHMISPDAALAGFKLVIAPALNVLTPAQAETLAAFAHAGGHLVITPRSGMKDDANALLPLRQPGWLREAAGAEVEEYYALIEPVAVEGEINGACTIWGERIKVLDEANTRILARYGAGLGWLTGQPAVTVHSYGAGKVYLVGAHLDAAGQDELCALLVRDAQLEPVLATPAGVEACLRVTPDGRRVCILINQSGQPQHVPLDGLYHNHLTGDSAAEIWLAVYAAAVLTPHTPEEVAAQSPLTL
jgi:beta-galactosidase